MDRRERAQAAATVGDLIADCAAARRAVAVAATSLAREAPRLRETVSAIRSLPQVPLDLSDTPEGRDIMSSYIGRRRGIPRRVAVSRLALPEDPADYLRGRRRQAVRTNCTKARAAGLVYTRPASREHAIELIMSVTDRRTLGVEERTWLIGRVRGGRGDVRLVVDESNRPVALIHFTIDREVCRLDVGVSAESEVTSLGRYLLSAQLFVELAGLGVRSALADSDLVASRGIRYFKERLGFEPVNLRLGELPPWVHKRAEMVHDPASMPVPR